MDNSEAQEEWPIGFWDSLKGVFGFKQRQEPGDAAEQFGLRIIASQKLEERQAKWAPVAQELMQDVDYEKPAAAIQTLVKRTEMTFLTIQTITIPYLRAMEKENAMFGIVAKVYIQISDLVIGYGKTLERTVKSDIAVNKYEIAAGFNDFYAKSARLVAFYIVALSFGNFDVSPETALMINAVGQQYGYRSLVPTDQMAAKNPPPQVRKNPPSLPSEV